MEEFRSFLLTRAQESDHMNVHKRDFFQIQGDSGTIASHAAHNLAEMLRPRAPNQTDGGSFSIRTSVELEHRLPPSSSECLVELDDRQ
jgi:hypothetical protein